MMQMKTTTNFAAIIAALSLQIGTPALAQSQDLDAIQPTSPPPVEEAPTTESKEVKSSSSEVKPDANIAVSRSASSKAIEDKLVLGTGLGWISLSGQGGNWAAGFHNQLFMTYALPVNVAGFALAGSFRYLPMDVTPKIDNNSYRGVVEGLMFGAEGRMKVTVPTNMTYVATAELGFMKTSLDPADDLAKVSSHGKSGVSLAVGGGADWTFLSMLAGGPRVRLGFGSYSMVEISGAIGCYF
jgi:hypothetical protein